MSAVTVGIWIALQILTFIHSQSSPQYQPKAVLNLILQWQNITNNNLIQIPLFAGSLVTAFGTMLIWNYPVFGSYTSSSVFNIARLVFLIPISVTTFFAIVKGLGTTGIVASGIAAGIASAWSFVDGG